MSNSISKGKTTASGESAAKLILTADFRVSEPSVEQPDVDIVETVTDNVRQLLTGREQKAESKGANASSLESTIAELEAAIDQQNGEWEPDGSGFEEAASTRAATPEPVQEWVDSASKEAVAKEASNAMDNKDTDADRLTDEESVIDEETLRGIVADIVRQELQGVLGERITRNVRKLVRREINLVLSTQDFE